MCLEETVRSQSPRNQSVIWYWMLNVHWTANCSGNGNLPHV